MQGGQVVLFGASRPTQKDWKLPQKSIYTAKTKVTLTPGFYANRRKPNVDNLCISVGVAVEPRTLGKRKNSFRNTGSQSNLPNMVQAHEATSGR